MINIASISNNTIEFTSTNDPITLSGDVSGSGTNGITTLVNWPNGYPTYDTRYSTPSSTDTFTNKSGNISQWSNDSEYLTGNELIILSGDVTGSGTSGISTIVTWSNGYPTYDARYVTPSSTNTFTNKSGNISQWFNDVGYLTNDKPIILSGDVSGTGTSGIATSVNWTSGYATYDSRYTSKIETPLNVKDYGAVGDGITDDTVAINAALAAMGTLNKDLFLPSGTYLVNTYTAPILSGSSNKILRVENSGIVKFRIFGEKGTCITSSLDNGTQLILYNKLTDCVIENIFFQNTHAVTLNQTGAIYLSGTSSQNIKNLKIKGCRFEGYSTAILTQGVTGFTIEDCIFESPLGHDNAQNNTQPAVYVWFHDNPGQGVCIDVKIRNCVANGFSGTDITTTTTKRPMDGFLDGTVYGLEYIGNTTKNFSQEHIILYPTVPASTTVVVDSYSLLIADSHFYLSVVPNSVYTPTSSTSGLTSNYGVRADCNNVNISNCDFFDYTSGILILPLQFPTLKQHGFKISNNRFYSPRTTTPVAYTPYEAIKIQGSTTTGNAAYNITVDSNYIDIDGITLQSNRGAISIYNSEKVNVMNNTIYSQNVNLNGYTLNGILLSNLNNTTLKNNNIIGIATPYNISGVPVGNLITDSTVPTLGDLQLRNGGVPNEMVTLLGNITFADSAPKNYYWNSTSIATIDNISIVGSTSGTGRWVALPVQSNLITPIVYGSSTSGGALRLDSTSNSIKGNIYFDDSSGFDSINMFLGIGTPIPQSKLHLVGNIKTSAWTTNGIGLRIAPAVYTDTTSNGAVPTVYAHTIGSPTFATSSVTTYSQAATLFIDKPTAGTNATDANISSLILGGDLQLQTGSTAKIGTIDNNGLNIRTNSISRILLTASGQMTFQNTGSASGSVPFIQFTQAVNTGGSGSGFLWTAAPHTGQANNTEITDINFNLSANMKMLDGTSGLQRAFRIQGRTYTPVTSNLTLIEASTLEVNPPIAGIGTIIDTNYAIKSTGNIGLIDANLVLGSTSGTMIGTSITQKLAFWNATPIVQPTIAITASTFIANPSTNTVFNESTFDGYTIAQIVKALRSVGLLA
jgi:hypothetical protein